jgi:hypothetical protein
LTTAGIGWSESLKRRAKSNLSRTGISVSASKFCVVVPGESCGDAWAGSEPSLSVGVGVRAGAASRAGAGVVAAAGVSSETGAEVCRLCFV